jgi:hypothetical protein
MNIAEPDNGADTTITLAISGNRLVSVLNALDQSLHQLGTYWLEGNTVVAATTWYTDLYAITEAIRDELSRQRCEART